MNKILVEVSAGELLDKISILEIKKHKIKSPDKLKYINEEYQILKEQQLKNLRSTKELDDCINRLKKINESLWVKEDKKRLCEKNQNFGKNFIEISRDIHILNDKRAEVKLEINNYTKSKIKEIKEYTKY